MAFGYDGSIRIKADLNHNQFDRGISSMTAKVESFGSTLRKVAGTVAAAFGVAALINFGKEAVKAASALDDAWMGLESIVSGQGKSFSKAKSFINDYISDGLVPLENAVTAYKNLAARGYSTEQIEQTMTALKDAAAFGRQASYSLGDAVTSATEGLKNENSILVDNAGVTKNVAKMWDDYAKSIGTTANKLTQEQKIQAEVNGILEETRFQTGDAAKLVNTYSGQIALLGYNFQNLKVQVGQAIMPIVQAVLPGINAIIAAITKLATVFAQVTALLFGKSTQVKATSGVAASASAASDSTDDLADALGGAGDAAKQAGKDMKSVTAPFDEFNILADNAAGSADSLADNLDMSGVDIDIPEFEADTGSVEELGEAFKSLGELFNSALDDMLDGIPAFRDSLLEFAGNFNEFNQKLYDAFKFPGLTEKVQQLGVELAAAFNDLVTAIDWELWGRTLGAGINLGLEFLVSFLYGFDWINLGKKLAEFVNGLVYEIDWYDFGRLLWTQFKIGLETFAGFIIGLDMPELAKAASNIVMGFFDEMKNTIANIDWSEIGAQVAEFLNNIDWVGVINSIAGALSGMVGAGLELVAGFIQNADLETLIVAIGFLSSGLVKKIISTVVSPLAKELVDQVIKKIAEAMTSSGFVSIIGTIGQAISGIGTILGGVTFAVSSFISMWNDGFSLAKEAVMLLGVALTAVGAIILGAPATVAAAVAGIVAAVATAAVLIHEHWEEIRQWFSDMWAGIQEIAGSIAGWFDSNVIQPAKQLFSDLSSNIKQLASDAWTGVQNAWNSASEWFNSTVVEPVIEAFSAMWEAIKQKASKIWEGVKGIWNAAKSWFTENVTEPIKTLFENAWNAVLSFLTETFTSGWKSAWDGLKNIVSNIIEGIKTMFSNALNFGKNLITSIFDDIANLANSILNLGSGGSSRSSSRGSSFGGSRMAVASIPESYSAYNLPMLANGAVIPPNHQFAAILGDQRSGTNIEAPLSTIKQAVTEAIQSMGGIGGDINITVESVLDGKVIARNTINHVNSMTRSSGRSPLLGMG